jgi:uncharacterized membrane protein
MSFEQNPYQAPGAALETPMGGDLAHASGQSVGVGRALDWWGAGWRLFTRSPGIWIANLVIFFLILVVMAFVPFLGNLATHLLFPVLAGGLMLGCRALDQGEDLEIEHLFAGFKDRAVPLLLVGVFYMIGTLIVVAIVIGIGLVVMGGAGIGALMSASGGHGNAAMGLALGGMGMGIALMGLVALALILPLAMSVWFAPALVVFHNMDALSAMKASFSGCLKNILPFLLYGIVYLVLAVIATIPLGLGWLVLGPMIVGSVYAAYTDIYLGT